MADAPLPKDWDKLLDHIAGTLSGVEETLAKAAAWEATAADVSRTHGHAELVAQQASRPAALDAKAAEITQWVDAIESELRVSEDLLRVLLNQTESVRQSLAAWAGRAIG